MKLWKLFGFAGIVALAATGCTSVNTNDAASDSKHAIVPAVYEPVIKHVDKKVAGESKMHVVLNFIKWGSNEFADRTVLGADATASSAISLAAFFPNPVRDAKAAAVYDACSKAKCDLLIGAKYKVTVKDYVVYKFIKCEVNGFPGTEVGVLKKDIAFPKSFNGVMTAPLY